MDDDAGTTPKLGRPRDSGVDRAVLNATLELLAEEGYAHLTMQRVATRAGVGKASLYRRWPTKVALILDVVSRNPGHPAVPDTGSLRDDMRTHLRALLRYRTPHSQAIGAISSEALCNPQFGELFRSHIAKPMVASFGVIVQRAVERGELPADTDVMLLASLPPALMQSQLLLSGRFPDEQLADRIVAQFFSPSGAVSKVILASSQVKANTVKNQPTVEAANGDHDENRNQK